MSNASFALPAAAWHADPVEPGKFRWWDGESWTEHTSAFAGIEEVPDPAPAAVQQSEFALPSSALALTTEPHVDPAPVQPRTRREWRDQQARDAAAAPFTEIADAAPVEVLAPLTIVEDAFPSAEPLSFHAMPVAPAPSFGSDEIPVELPAVHAVPHEVSTGFVPFYGEQPEPVFVPQPAASQGGAAPGAPGAPGIAVFAGLTPSFPDAAHNPAATGWAATTTQSETPIGSAQTAAGWILAFAPVWVGAALFAYYFALPNVDNTAIGWGVRVGIIIAALGLAKWDGATLTARGYQRAPILGLVVLLPFYFIMRAVRIGRGGIAPLLVHLAVLGAMSALVAWAFQTGLLAFTF